MELEGSGEHSIMQAICHHQTVQRVMTFWHDGSECRSGKMLGRWNTSMHFVLQEHAVEGGDTLQPQI